MKPQAFYYYHRDKQNRPIITRCFVTDGTRHGRGTAVCAEADNPCKATGRRIAFCRAMAAYNGSKPVYGDNPNGDVSFTKIQPAPTPFQVEEKFVELVRR